MRLAWSRERPGRKGIKPSRQRDTSRGEETPGDCFQRKSLWKDHGSTLTAHLLGCSLCPISQL